MCPLPPVILDRIPPKAAEMFCTVSGCLFIQSFPLLFSRYPMAYSLAPPAIRPLRALPPLLALVMAPSMPWRATFSADPSFHPLWDAISWIARFPTIPSSSNSCFLSSTFVLSKISLSLFRLFSVFLFNWDISCFWFSLSVMVMVPLATADLVVVPAFPLTDGMGVFRMPIQSRKNIK